MNTNIHDSEKIIIKQHVASNELEKQRDNLDLESMNIKSYPPSRS